MPLPTFQQLHDTADRSAPLLPVSVAGGADATVLQAVRHAADRKWVAPILAGRTEEIRRIADEHSITLDGFCLIDSDTTASAAVAECREGRARLLMKGQVPTAELLRAILDPAHGLRTTRAICQVVLMEIPRDDRRFLLADTGILIRPDPDQKADVLRALVEVAHALGVDDPKVALMAASEKVTAAMPETLDAAELEVRWRSGAFPRCAMQGPLSFDLAYAAAAADKKRISGPVVGAADAMLFPDLSSANLTVKAIMYTADCRFGGVLRGAACPVVFMSRADTVDTRLNSLALALSIVRSEAC